jgi:hypothetical protein
MARRPTAAITSSRQERDKPQTAFFADYDVTQLVVSVPPTQVQKFVTCRFALAYRLVCIGTFVAVLAQ